MVDPIVGNRPNALDARVYADFVLAELSVDQGGEFSSGLQGSCHPDHPNRLIL
jgi:hypothetical protein